MKTVAVLHQELTSAHQSETRSYLITELEVDLIKVQRQLFVTFDTLTYQIDHHFFMGRSKYEVVVLSVFKAQQLFSVLFKTPTLLPERCRRYKSKAYFLASGFVQLLFNNIFHFIKYTFPHRKEVVKPTAAYRLDKPCTDQKNMACQCCIGVSLVVGTNSLENLTRCILWYDDRFYTV